MSDNTGLKLYNAINTYYDYSINRKVRIVIKEFIYLV